MHDRLNVNATNYSPTNARAVPNINHTSACNDARELTKTYAAAAASPTQESPRATCEPEDLTSKTLTITLGAKKLSHDPSPQNSQETETNPTDSNTSGFIAARRKNVISYFVGNIDADVNKRDIYDYMKLNGVTPTYINLYCGRNGAAAKVNVHADDQHKVKNEHFWPNDIVARLWVSK